MRKYINCHCKHSLYPIACGILSIVSPKIDFRCLINTSSERPMSKLSENHRINVIGPTELNLWPFKDALFNARSPSFLKVLELALRSYVVVKRVYN